MQNAIPLGIGAMAAIVGLTDEQVSDLCVKSSNAKEQVTPANYNAIGQVVIAGHAPAVQRAIVLAEEAGARLAKIIPVSVPCHCPLLTEAAELFAESLALVPFRSPAIDVISNVDLSIYYSPQHIRDKLKEQLYSPVRWVETIQYFKNKEISLVVECGPGKVLNGLTKRIERSLNTISIYDTINLDQLVEQVRIPA
jgi:[acyl-carrier-protein] S-malonyltransferase